MPSVSGELQHSKCSNCLQHHPLQNISKCWQQLSAFSKTAESCHSATRALEQRAKGRDVHFHKCCRAIIHKYKCEVQHLCRGKPHYQYKMGNERIHTMKLLFIMERNIQLLLEYYKIIK